MNFGQSLVQIMSAMSAIDGNADEKELSVLLEISKKLGVS
jgi:tellurite resistance protein